jgi:hypothetical protein
MICKCTERGKEGVEDQQNFVGSLNDELVVLWYGGNGAFSKAGVLCTGLGEARTEACVITGRSVELKAWPCWHC